MYDPRRTVVFDVDDVCNHFTQPLLDAVRKALYQQEQFAESKAVPNEDAITSYDISKCVSKKAWQTACFLLSTKRWFWSKLPPIAEARAAVELLRSKDVHVLFATAPWVDCKDWDSIRRHWLFEYFDASHKDVLIGSAKWAIRCALLIEDCVETLRDWVDANQLVIPFRTTDFPRPALIARPWNQAEQHSMGLPRYTWPDLIDRLQEWF